MTTEDAIRVKILAQNEIGRILVELMKNTGCRVTGISLTTEEGFGYEAEILTDVSIKLEIR